jgi:hypothetical protein
MIFWNHGNRVFHNLLPIIRRYLRFQLCNGLSIQKRILVGRGLDMRHTINPPNNPDIQKTNLTKDTSTHVNTTLSSWLLCLRPF